MIGLFHRVALRAFGRMPVRLRRRIVRTVSPSFTVGAMCFIERDDGALLLVRHSYRARWGVPGGLLKKGEPAEDGARREVLEEVGLMVELVGSAAVVVDAEPQRVDLVFRARPVGPVPDRLEPRSPEILDVRWFAPSALPELQFETADALMTLARTVTGPVRRRLPDPVWPSFDARSRLDPGA